MSAFGIKAVIHWTSETRSAHVSLLLCHIHRRQRATAGNKVALAFEFTQENALFHRASPRVLILAMRAADPTFSSETVVNRRKYHMSKDYAQIAKRGRAVAAGRARYGEGL